MQLMQDRHGKVRAPALVALIIVLHGAIIGSVLCVQGCGTTKGRKTQTAEAPPAPQMPPREGMEASPVTPRPVFEPPVGVEPALSTTEGTAGSTYTVGKGDSLSKIASRNGVSAREIAELNNIKDPNKIRVGQKLLLPAYASSQPAPKPAAKKSTASATKSIARPAGEGDYSVKSGDSLSKIASRNGTTVKALREANNLKSDMIRVGQKLNIPGAKKKATKSEKTEKNEAESTPAPEPTPAIEPAASASEPISQAIASESIDLGSSSMSADVPFEYQLKTGETLDDVARSFAVLKQDIVSLNGITDESTVQAGQKIKIPLSNP